MRGARGKKSHYLGSRAGQSCGSNFFQLLLLSVSHDGVEGYEESTGDRDEGEHLLLSSKYHCFGGFLEDRVLSHGAQRGDEQRGADHRYAAADEAFALPRT